MTTNKHLFSELIYVGPAAFDALVKALNIPSGINSEKSTELGTQIVADFLFRIAATSNLRVALISHNENEVPEEYVLNNKQSRACQVNEHEEEYMSLLCRMTDDLVSIHMTVVANKDTKKGIVGGGK